MAQSLVELIFERHLANAQEEYEIPQNQLLEHKNIADQLGDLMLNFFYNGLYQVFIEYSAIMLYLVNVLASFAWVTGDTILSRTPVIASYAQPLDKSQQQERFNFIPDW